MAWDKIIIFVKGFLGCWIILSSIEFINVLDAWPCFSGFIRFYKYSGYYSNHVLLNKQSFIFALTNLAGFSETRTIISLNIINQLFFVMKMQDPFCELQTETLNSPSKHSILYKVVLRWAKGLLVTLYSPLCKIFKTKCMHTNSNYS
jgi:hypothetical protein